MAVNFDNIGLFKMITEIHIICYILLLFSLIEILSLAFIFVKLKGKQTVVYCTTQHSLSVGDFVTINDEMMYVVSSTPNSITLGRKRPENISDKIRKYNERNGINK